MITDMIKGFTIKPKKDWGDFEYHKVFKIDGETFYCYSDLNNISNARRIQIDAILEGSVKLNITRDTMKIITAKMHDQAELAVGFMMSFIADLDKACKTALVSPASVMELNQKNNLQNILTILQNLRDVNLEMGKRANMLTLPVIMYEVAALLFFSKKENPRKMLPEAEVTRRVELFKKKDILAELLETPMWAIFYQIQPSLNNSKDYFLLRLKETQAIANWQEAVLQGIEYQPSNTKN